MGCRLWGHTESDTTEATQQQQQEFLMYFGNEPLSDTCLAGIFSYSVIYRFTPLIASFDVQELLVLV